MRKVSKEEILKLESGKEYIIFNPLTRQVKIEIASPIDIAHNKHCYDGLEFYIWY